MRRGTKERGERWEGREKDFKGENRRKNRNTVFINKKGKKGFREENVKKKNQDIYYA